VIFIETIAAISTPVGAGGIAVIRISGERALVIADKLFTGISSSLSPSEMPGYTCAYGKIIYKNEILDECILTVFKSPRSYTGEDVVEISVHGGIFTAETVLDAVCDCGARLARAGEFTERAFLAGKMTLTQAEAVMDIIAAKGAAELRSALAVRDGAVYNKIHACSGQLTLLLSELGVWADYPDDNDNISDISYDKILSVIDFVTSELRSLDENFRVGELIKTGIPLCIAGKPNVGKSSLMNLLSGTRRSIVTDIPGTTRDAVENDVRIGDYTFRITDTAGIRETADAIEKTGTDLAKEKIAAAAVVCAVFDASQALDDDDLEIIRLTEGKNAVAVLNKTDKLQIINEEYIKAHFKTVVKCSAKNAEGVAALTEAVTALPGLLTGAASAPVILNARQHSAAGVALRLLEDARTAAVSGVPFDALTILIDAAAAALLELTGETVTGAVADSIFAHFCVGK
jgi:tRNA modification GTPase